MVSRDAIWLNQVYGEYKGDRRIWDVVPVVPSRKSVRFHISKKTPDQVNVDNQYEDDDDDDDSSEPEGKTK